MLKEYLEELRSANQDEMNGLEKKINQLVQDLECGQEWVEKLQRDQNMDASIFSPRSQNPEKQKNLEAARKNVEEIKQQIEYTREKIEELVKKRSEYDNLLVEAESSVPEKNKEDKVIKESDGEKIPLSSFLYDLHKKTDICLALLNGDKNKCRNELRAMKRQIKEYAEQIEKS